MKTFFLQNFAAFMKNTAFLLLGGNTGNVYDTFYRAKQLIVDSLCTINSVSSVYHSRAWGFESDDLFLNQALEIKTNISCEILLLKLQAIELSLGRLKTGTGYASRNIDIDILFFNQDIITLSNLIVPHPRLHLRNFALKPMAELAPDFIHPVFNTTIVQLLDICPDILEVNLQNTPQAS